MVVDALRLRTHPATESHTHSERQDRDHHRANHGASFPIAGDQTAPLTANLNPPSSTATRYKYPLCGFVSAADRSRRNESSWVRSLPDQDDDGHDATALRARVRTRGFFTTGSATTSVGTDSGVAMSR